MTKPTARKPSGAVEGFSMSKGQKQCGGAALLIAFIVGLSHYFSPSADADAEFTALAKPSVTALDDTNFDKFVAEHPEGILVDFYSKSCKFCVKLAPQFEKAAKELKVGGPPLATVDSETGAKIVEKYDITRYPTVLWIWKGQNVLEFPRASEKPAAKIVDWAKWAMTPSVQELETEAEFVEALPTLRSTLSPTRGRLFVAFNRQGSADMREAYEAAAQRNRATTVFLYLKESLGPGPTLKMFGPDDSNDEEYQGGATQEEVVQWVKGNLDKAKPAVEEPKAEDAKEKPVEEKSAAVKAMEQIEEVQKNAAAAKEQEAADAKE